MNVRATREQVSMIYRIGKRFGLVLFLRPFRFSAIFGRNFQEFSEKLISSALLDTTLHSSSCVFSSKLCCCRSFHSKVSSGARDRVSEQLTLRPFDRDCRAVCAVWCGMIQYATQYGIIRYGSYGYDML